MSSNWYLTSTFSHSKSIGHLENGTVESATTHLSNRYSGMTEAQRPVEKQRAGVAGIVVDMGWPKQRETCRSS